MPSPARPRFCRQAGCPRRVTRDGYCSDHAQTVVNVVIGPPCSGKTSYVAAHAQPGDLIVDYDALMAALSGRPGHIEDAALRGYAAEARDAVLGRLAQRRAGPEPGAAWVIATHLTPVGDLPLRVHVMATPVDECIRRLYAHPDGRSVAKVSQAIRAYPSEPLPAHVRPAGGVRWVTPSKEHQPWRP